MFEHQPLVVYLCVSECICVSADMSPYCSAHDEWLIMKLLHSMTGSILPTMYQILVVTQLIVNVYQMIK